MSETASQATPVRARRARTEAPPAPITTPEPEAPSMDMPGPALAGFVRKPFGARQQKLDNSQRPGFHRHWFNDTPGRIQTALEAGYVHVLGSDGKPMSRIVGTKEGGGGLLAYRMEIPLEWYEADQAAKESAREELFSQMRRGVTSNGAPGDDGRYLPEGPDGKPRIKIENGAAR